MDIHVQNWRIQCLSNKQEMLSFWKLRPHTTVFGASKCRSLSDSLVFSTPSSPPPNSYTVDPPSTPQVPLATFHLTIAPPRHRKISDATKSAIYLVVDIDNVDEREQLRYFCVVGAVYFHATDVISITEYQVRLLNWKPLNMLSLLHTQVVWFLSLKNLFEKQFLEVTYIK